MGHFNRRREGTVGYPWRDLKTTRGMIDTDGINRRQPDDGEYRRKSRRFPSIRVQNDLAVSARAKRSSSGAESSIVLSV